jgi:hypothetical protein
VSERICSDLASDLDLSTGNERASHGGAEQILSAINRSGTQRGPHEILDKFLPEILDVALVRAGSNRLGPYAFQLLSLAYVRGDADDTRAVTLLEPRDDDRSVEPTGVGEGNCTNHRRLNKYSEYLNI